MNTYLLILSIIVSDGSYIESYPFENKGKCERMLPKAVEAARKLYPNSDVLATCLPKVSDEDLNNE